MRRRIRTGPCTAQTAVRRAGWSCFRTWVVLAILESSPYPGVGGLVCRWHGRLGGDAAAWNRSKRVASKRGVWRSMRW